MVMKIQQQLPQFNHENALLIVAGKQTGVLYHAAEGRIEKLEALEEETPRYSDREGFFASGSGAKPFTSGAVYEENKQEIIKKFAKKLSREADRIVRDKNINAVYLFTPDYTTHELNQDLSREVQSKIKHTFLGNYADLHPFKLLGKIQDERF